MEPDCATSNDPGITCLTGRWDSYYRLLNDDNFTSNFVAEIDETNGSAIVGFVIFHIAADFIRDLQHSGGERLRAFGPHREAID